MTPDALLTAVAAVYATTPTYRDSGAVVTRTFTPDGVPRFATERPFETAFVRPGQFRFEYRSRFRDRDHWNRHVVWMDGPAVRTWWDVSHRLETPDSLDDALAAATGVSGGSAHTVPRLLLPDAVTGESLTDLLDPAELPDDGRGGAACHVVRGHFPPPEPDTPEQAALLRRPGLPPPQRCEYGPVTFWVDRATLLVRRVESTDRFETFHTHTVTTYDSEAGGEVAVEELRFGAPDPDLE